MIYHKKDIEKAAQFVLAQIGENKLVAFEAEMGSGKTTLITAICKLLGVIDLPSSPTFSIINEYATIDDKSIYHIDLYRVKDEEELLQIGLEEIIYSGNYCFIEWPQIAENILPKSLITIEINLINEEEREIVVEKN